MTRNQRFRALFRPGHPFVCMRALSQRDMFAHIRRVCRATSLPVFADADTGYGGMLEAHHPALGGGRRVVPSTPTPSRASSRCAS